MSSEIQTTSTSSKIATYVHKFNELKAVFDSLPDGVVAILDSEMKIATMNTAMTKILNLPTEDILTRKSNELFQRRLPALIPVLERTIQTKKGVRNYTIENISSDGEINSFLVSTTVIDELDESEFGIVLILHDISEITRLRKLTLQMHHYDEIIGKSETMKRLFALIESIKDYDTSVLIFGETGTGKEIVARALHNVSRRKNKPFIPINCSALPANLIESELFGHVKGAFTGAISTRPGRFQLAHEGTLFLDEIGTLPMDLQAKLLRVLQEMTVSPLGSSEENPVDVRIISATNRDLALLVAKNEFREDLFYRIKVLQVTLPPLRERKDDILLLASHFITRLNRYYNKNIVGLSPSAQELLEYYPWPGNVRELENAIEHAFVLTTGVLLERHLFPPEIRHTQNNGVLPPPADFINTNLNVKEEGMRRTLMATHGNLSETAKILDMHRTTLWRKMKEFRIDKNFGKPKKK